MAGWEQGQSAPRWESRPLRDPTSLEPGGGGCLQSAETCLVGSQLRPASPAWPQPGPADLKAETGTLLAQPCWAQVLPVGKPAAQDPALGSGYHKLRPFSARVLGLSWARESRGRATFQPGCWTPGFWLHSSSTQESLGRWQREGGEGPGGTVLGTSMCKVQAARAAEHHWGGQGSHLECGWDLRSWLPGRGRQRFPQGTGKGQLKY